MERYFTETKEFTFTGRTKKEKKNLSKSSLEMGTSDILCLMTLFEVDIMSIKT